MSVIATCFVAMTFIACSDGDDRTSGPSRSRGGETTEAPTAEPTYRVVEVTESGSIRGNVRWRGEVPEPPRSPVLAHNDVCGDSQPARTLTVSPSGGVSDVVVSIDIRTGAALPEERPAAVVDNVGCRFEPHITAVGVGALLFRNSDEVLHNVHGFAGERSMIDLGLPERGSLVERTLAEPTVLRLVCDAGHGWQQAWVHAFEHPYFAVTDERGRFEIPEVPPGIYTLRLWHEGWRVVGRGAGRIRWSNPVVLSRSVTVATEQETTVDFELGAESAEIAGD